MQKLFAIGCAGLMLVGCASPQVVHERGWIGGTLATARPATPLLMRSESGPVVAGFPSELRGEYRGGVLISDLPSKTPLARAGLEEGDLILRVDGQPVSSLKALRRVVDARKPGTPLPILIHRENQLIERTMVVGREKYREEHVITLAVGLSSNLNFDLIPDPSFSLVALGFDDRQERLELQNPQMRYVHGLQPAESPDRQSEAAVVSPEGWRAWIGILSLGKHKLIVSQEALEPITAFSPLIGARSSTVF